MCISPSCAALAGGPPRGGLRPPHYGPPARAISGGNEFTEAMLHEQITGPDDPNLKPGVAIAKGWNDQGRYPNNSHGNHAALVVDPAATDDGIPIYKDGEQEVKIYNQWNDRPAHTDTLSAKQIRECSVITRRK